MNHETWIKRWEEKNIGWHEEEGSPLLKKHYDLLQLKKDDKVFMPLCGKSRDIHFFLAKGQKVLGCELSSIAIKELFEELNLSPKIEKIQDFTIYTASNITIFEGDIFKLNKELIGDIDAIYDRASIVALPKELRGDYSKLLRDISNKAKQLLISFDYEQELHPKTPFSVPFEEISSYHKEFYSIKKVDSMDVEGGLKGFCPAKEEVYIFTI